MECKELGKVGKPKASLGIDLTRMECKEERAPKKNDLTFGIDLTRMECKGCISIPS